MRWVGVESGVPEELNLDFGQVGWDFVLADTAHLDQQLGAIRGDEERVSRRVGFNCWRHMARFDAAGQHLDTAC